MIRLRTLRVENFKILREIGLIFPPVGSILVEGLNESGKSTLFESIYFGLYGRPLVSEGTIESVIRYGATDAVVELSLSVDETELTIERQLRVGRPGRARLVVSRPDGYLEEITRLSAISERLLSELGGLDGETLLNSCFVEQKKLQRLEGLDAGARRNALLRLLNLESLTQLEGRFKLGRQDDEALRVAEARRDLTALRARRPACEATLAELDRRLAARRIRSKLDQSDRLTRLLDEGRRHLAALDVRQAHLQGQLNHVDRLALAETGLGDLLHLLERRDAEASANRALKAELLELRHLEARVLPEQEQRLLGLDRLADRLARLQHAEQAAEALAAGLEAQRLADAADLERSDLERRSAELLERLDRLVLVRQVSQQAIDLRDRLGQHASLTASLVQRRAELDALIALRDDRLPTERARFASLLELANRLDATAADLAEARREVELTAALDSAERALAEARSEQATSDQQLAELGELLESAAARRRAARAARSPALAPTLLRWLEAGGEMERVDQTERDQASSSAQVDLHRARIVGTSSDIARCVRSRLIRSIFGLVALLAGCGLLFVAPPVPALLVLLLGLIGLIAAFDAGRRLGQLRADQLDYQSGLEQAQQRLLATQTTLAALGDGPRQRFATAATALLELGLEPPVDLEAGRRELASVEQRDADSEQARQREQDAEQELAELLREQGSAERRAQAAKELVEERQATLSSSRAALIPRADETALVATALLHRRRDGLVFAEQRHAAARADAEQAQAGATSSMLRERAAALHSTLEGLEQRVSELGSSESRLVELEAEARQLRELIQAGGVDLADRLQLPELAGPERPPSVEQLDALQHQLEQQLARFDEPGLRSEHSFLIGELGAARQRVGEHRATVALANRRAAEAAADLCTGASDDSPDRLVAELLRDLSGTGVAPPPAALEELQTRLRQWRQAVQREAEPLVQPSMMDDLATARARLTAERDHTVARLGQLAVLQSQFDQANSRLGELESALAASLADLEDQLATLGHSLRRDDLAVQRGELAAERRGLNSGALRSALDELVAERGKTEADLAHHQADLSCAQTEVDRELSDLRLAACSASRAAVEAALPELMDPELEQESDLDQERDQLLAELGHLRRESERLELAWGLTGLSLDLDDCQRELDRAVRERAVKQRAVRILTMARTSMIGRVLPTTEQNLRLLLPRLTDDRYHDATLSDDYQLQVWDVEAGRYVAREIFSGGARDQFSLALRLAFALATLPQELGTTPGFIFLDEPLSAFDPPRTEALVDLLTTGQIARSFAQIFLISHSRTFDPARFPYYLRLQAGRVAETNLSQI